MSFDLEFEAEMWEYTGEAAWCFVTLPRKMAREVEEVSRAKARPGGTVKVMARVGGARWQTSLFRDLARGTYLLPVKEAVRTKERLRPGDRVRVELQSVD